MSEINNTDAPQKLTKRDPLFYQKIGARGGKATLASKGLDHFAEAARIRHRKDSASSVPVDAQGDAALRAIRAVRRSARKTTPII